MPEMVVVVLPDVVDMPGPALSPRDVSPEILRQAQRCLLAYIGWLVDDAPARHPSWAEDELQRALRRLVEVQAAAKTARAKLH